MINLRSYTDVKISNKITIFFSVIIGAMIIASVIGITQMNQIGTELTEISEHDMPLTKKITNITIHQLEQGINFERALRHAQVENWAEYGHAKEAFHNYATLVDEEFITAEHMAEEAITIASTDAAKQEFEHVLSVLTKIDKEHLEYEDHVNHIFSLIESNQISEATTEIELTEAMEEEIDHEIEALLVEVEEFTENAIQKAETDEQLGILVLIVASIIATIVGIISTIIVKRMISPLSKITEVANKISEGDLTLNIPKSNSKDEIAQLNNAQKRVTENLRKIIGNVSFTTQSVVNDATSVASSIEQLSSGVEQVSSTVQQISEGSQSQASDLSDAKIIVDTITNNTDGESASEKMTKIVELTKESSEKVKGLAEKSSKITDVVEVIRKIAEKTNLLALNAAIEAARAGESGRGFAVVADEVRRLAEGSAKSSQEIDELLREIQDEIKSTVTKIDKSSKEVEAGRHVVEKSLQALENIGQKVQDISAVSEQNAAASEQASASVEQQTAATEDINTSSQQMKNLAKDLEKEINIFKIPAEDTSNDSDTKKLFKKRDSKKDTSNNEWIQVTKLNK